MLSNAHVELGDNLGKGMVYGIVSESIKYFDSYDFMLYDKNRVEYSCVMTSRYDEFVYVSDVVSYLPPVLL